MTSEYALQGMRPGNANAQEHVHTSALPEKHDDYGVQKSHITLTQIDEGDMYRLGRQQELNVRESPNVVIRKGIR